MGGGGAGRPALIRASFTLERFHSSASSILPRLLAPIPWPALSPRAFLFGLVLFYFQSRAASVVQGKGVCAKLVITPAKGGKVATFQGCLLPVTGVKMQENKGSSLLLSLSSKASRVAAYLLAQGFLQCFTEDTNWWVQNRYSSQEKQNLLSLSRLCFSIGEKQIGVCKMHFLESGVLESPAGGVQWGGDGV